MVDDVSASVILELSRLSGVMAFIIRIFAGIGDVIEFVIGLFIAFRRYCTSKFVIPVPTFTFKVISSL